MVNSVICSHYVPKRHLKRFMNEDDKIIIFHNFGEMRDVVSDFKNMKLLGLNNFYDFCEDPNTADSNEKRFEIIEKILGDEIDLLINGHSYSILKLVQYVSFLDSRSLSKRLLIDNYQIYKGNPKYANSKDPVKEFHQNLIYSSLYYISTYSVHDYTVEVVRTESDMEFFTSDCPVIELPRKIIMMVCANYPIEMEDYPVFLCPVSPNICIIAYNKKDYVCEQLIDSGYFTDSHCNVVNAFTSGLAVEALCVSHDPDQYFIDCFRDKDHPRTRFLVSYTSVVKNSPKKVRPKYLNSC